MAPSCRLSTQSEPGTGPGVEHDLLVEAALEELLQVSVLIFDRELRFRAVRGAAAERHGYLAELLVGRRAAEVLPAAVWDAVGPSCTRALAGEAATICMTRPSGAAQELVFQPVRRDGALIGGMVTTRDLPGAAPAEPTDLAELRAAQADLAGLQARTQAILDHAPLNIFLRDLEGRWLTVSRELQRVLGRSEEELLGETTSLTHSLEHQQRFSAEDHEVLRTGRPQESDVTFPDATRGGEPRHYWLQKFPVRDAAGDIIGLGGISLDVTDRERIQRELLAAQQRFAAAFEHAPIGKLISRLEPHASDSRVLRCNAAFAELLGYAPEELAGRSGSSFVHPDDTDRRDRLIADAREGHRTRGEIRMVHRDGRAIWSLIAPAIVRDADGAEEIIIQALDITERKDFEDQLRRLADHDPLTDLLGRRRFREDLDREVARVRRSEGRSCLLLLDLDGFKHVNDAFGHSAGDELLVRISRALQGAARDGDVVGRIGGDEFALLLPGADAAGGHRAARRIIAAVAANGSVVRGGRSARVTASAGLTVLAGAACPDGEQVLIEADTAMYGAKQAGRDRVVRYDRVVPQHAG